MSKPKFDVKLSSYEQVRSIEGGWSAADYRKLLELVEFPSDDTTTEVELREICVMCLQDWKLPMPQKLF